MWQVATSEWVASFALIALCCIPPGSNQGYDDIKKTSLASKQKSGISFTNDDNSRYSYMVAILSNSSGEVSCGGGLLTTTAILTACHCLCDEENEYASVEDYYAVAGAPDLSSGDKQVRHFQEFTVHSNCNTTEIAPLSNVGLAFVKEPFELRDNVKLVKFISGEKMGLGWWYTKFVFNTKICHILGWGSKSPNQHLKDTPVKLASNHECRSFVKNWYSDCTNQTSLRGDSCALHYQKGSIYRSDSGSPLLCNDYVFGVVTMHPSACEESVSNRTSTLLPLNVCDPLTTLDFITQHIPNYQVPSQNRKSINVLPFKYLFVVTVANTSDADVPMSLCAGSVLTDSSVVTTCKCLKQLIYSQEATIYKDVAVVWGLFDIYDDPSWSRKLYIIRIALHDECSDQISTELADVGIAFVKDKFPLSTRMIQPLKMPTDDLVTLRRAINLLQNASGECVIVSWGYSQYEPTQIRYNELSQWNIRLFSPEQCRAKFCNEELEQCSETFYSNEEICGEAYNASQFCFADEGGPLICNNMFFGHVSYGGELCSPNNTVKLTSVLQILQFVQAELPDYTVECPNLKQLNAGSSIWAAIFWLCHGSVAVILAFNKYYHLARCAYS